MALAMERNEVDAMGGISWDVVKNTKSEWLTEKKAKVLYTFSTRRLSDLPDTPALADLAVDDESRSILSFIGGSAEVGRSLVAEPGTPPERAAALRQAFMDTMGDPAFLAEMAQRKLLVEPLNGAEVQKLIAAAVATPPALLERAKRYVGGAK
jgi:tripartite-type tricarboxylate transporter receptor subunit TctC